MKHIVLCAVAMALCACASNPEKPPQIITVTKEIVVKCAKPVPKPDLISNDTLYDLDAPQALAVLFTDRLIRQDYEMQLESEIKACE